VKEHILVFLILPVILSDPSLYAEGTTTESCQHADGAQRGVFEEFERSDDDISGPETEEAGYEGYETDGTGHYDEYEAGMSPDGNEAVLLEKQSLYHFLRVTESCGIRRLAFRRKGGEHEESVINLADPLDFRMSHYRTMLATFAHSPEPKSILFIGLGGGTLSMAIHHYFPEAHVDNVELDPEVAKAAVTHFGVKEDARMKVYVRDGRVQARRFRRQGRKYDVIMMDAFRGGYIPYHLTTREFLQCLQLLLTPDGVVVTNLRPGFESYHYHRRTLAAVFRNQWSYGSTGNVIVVTSMQANPPGHEALVATAQRLHEQRRFRTDIVSLIKAGGMRRDFNTEGPILTDDYAPTDVLRSIRRD